MGSTVAAIPMAHAEPRPVIGIWTVHSQMSKMSKTSYPPISPGRVPIGPRNVFAHSASRSKSFEDKGRVSGSELVTGGST